MKCPCCQHVMTIVAISNVNVDVCQSGCGGIWFDKFEFKKFDESHEPDLQALVKNQSQNQIQDDTSKRYNCPKCTNVVLMRNFSSPKQQVAIDTCANCAGIFLDSGELNKIRSEYPNEEARTQAIDSLFTNLIRSYKSK